jgi:hypothetical protein
MEAASCICAFDPFDVFAAACSRHRRRRPDLAIGARWRFDSTSAVGCYTNDLDSHARIMGLTDKSASARSRRLGEAARLGAARSFAIATARLTIARRARPMRRRSRTHDRP